MKENDAWEVVRVCKADEQRKERQENIQWESDWTNLGTKAFFTFKGSSLRL